MLRKRLLKIIAAAFALFLIWFLFSAVIAFMGNPISAAIATSKIRAYVKETYPSMDLEVPRANYNFKDSDYYSHVRSTSSIDTAFRVGYRKGKISDDYPFEVANRFSTYRRISMEFDKAVEDILKAEFPYDTSILIADFNKSEEDFDKLTLDMELDINNPPIPAYLTVYIVNKEVSYEFLQDRLLELHKIMENHKIPISIYTVVVKEPLIEGELKGDPHGKQIYLFDFPEELILEPNLIENIKAHQKQWEEEANREKDKEMINSIKN